MRRNPVHLARLASVSFFSGSYDMPSTWERTVCGIGAEEASLSFIPPVDASIGRSVPFLSDASDLILKLYTISTKIQ